MTKKVYGTESICMNYIEKAQLHGNGIKKFLNEQKKIVYFVLVHHLMRRQLIF